MAVQVATAAMGGMQPMGAMVEAGFVRGFAGLKMLGNTSEVLRDGKERAKAALEQLGFVFPPRTMLLSVAPADIRTDGSHFDLAFAMAMAALLSTDALAIPLDRYVFCAELSIAGELRPVRGIVSMAIRALSDGMSGIVVARQNCAEVASLARFKWNKDQVFQVVVADCLRDVVQWAVGQPTGAAVGRLGSHNFTTELNVTKLNGTELKVTEPNVVDRGTQFASPAGAGCDFDDMVLTDDLKRLVLAHAVGAHSVIIRGSPGAGKSMLARRLGSVWPVMPCADHLVALRTYSAHAERIYDQLLAGRPPFRAPHHHATPQAITGTPEVPGELALAHGGILFLDEFGELRRDLIECLREPLETGYVSVARAQMRMIWPARAVLVAASNNCQCGYFGSDHQRCRCTVAALIGYWRKLSGPIMERIDIHYNMVAHPARQGGGWVGALGSNGTGQQTAELARLVSEGQAFAIARNAAYGAVLNRDLKSQDLLHATGLSIGSLERFVRRGGDRPSVRTMVRLLRLARTVADLDRAPTVLARHLDEAWEWLPDPAARRRGETVLNAGDGAN